MEGLGIEDKFGRILTYNVKPSGYLYSFIVIIGYSYSFIVIMLPRPSEAAFGGFLGYKFHTRKEESGKYYIVIVCFSVTRSALFWSLDPRVTG